MTNRVNPLKSPEKRPFLPPPQSAIGIGPNIEQLWNDFVGRLPDRYVELRVLHAALRDRKGQLEGEAREFVQYRLSALDAVLFRFEVYGDAVQWDQLGPKAQEDARRGNPNWKPKTTPAEDLEMVRVAKELLSTDPGRYEARRQGQFSNALKDELQARFKLSHRTIIKRLNAYRDSSDLH